MTRPAISSHKYTDIDGALGDDISEVDARNVTLAYVMRSRSRQVRLDIRPNAVVGSKQVCHSEKKMEDRDVKQQQPQPQPQHVRAGISRHDQTKRARRQTQVVGSICK
jgi:hypothetical protein